MRVPKATVARRSYNRALKDLERDLNLVRDAARETASVVNASTDPKFAAWLRGFDFARERVSRSHR